MTKCEICLNSRWCERERRCEFKVYDFKVIDYAKRHHISVSEAIELLRFCMEHEPEKKIFEEEEPR